MFLYTSFSSASLCCHEIVRPCALCDRNLVIRFCQNLAREKKIYSNPVFSHILAEVDNKYFLLFREILTKSTYGRTLITRTLACTAFLHGAINRLVSLSSNSIVGSSMYFTPRTRWRSARLTVARSDRIFIETQTINRVAATGYSQSAERRRDFIRAGRDNVFFQRRKRLSILRALERQGEDRSSPLRLLAESIPRVLPGES